MSELLTGIGELLTNDPERPKIVDAAIVVEGERIAWVGEAAQAPDADRRTYLQGRAMLPGWVDSHTHLVFAGDRSAEFEARTPYHYSSYDEETEVQPRTAPAVLILGSGPNRIGQGIEFDYSCVHAAMTLRDAGYETVMVNCNPETVSTDYDTSDRLYFEPLTFEDVLEVVEAERACGPVEGVLCQLGGQTPLGLAQRLKDRRHAIR